MTLDRITFLKGHLTSHTDVTSAHSALTVIYLTEPHSSLLLLLDSVDPDAKIDVKLVARKEHPSELANELDGREHIVDVCIRLEVVKVQSSEAHAQKLMTFVKCLFIPTRKCQIDAQYFLAIHSST